MLLRAGALYAQVGLRERGCLPAGRVYPGALSEVLATLGVLESKEHESPGRSGSAAAFECGSLAIRCRWLSRIQQRHPTKDWRRSMSRGEFQLIEGAIRKFWCIERRTATRSGSAGSARPGSSNQGVRHHGRGEDVA